MYYPDPPQDFRHAVRDTAITVSYPARPDGSRDRDATRLGDRRDIDATTEASRTLRREAVQIAADAGNAVPPRDEDKWYAHCSRWIAPIIIKHIDPRFPGDWTKYQLAHVKDPNSGWVRLGATLPAGDDLGPNHDVMRPGDLVITDEWQPSGHAVLWVGEHGGHPDMVTEASWGGIVKETGRMHPGSMLGGLRRLSETIDGRGVDKAGRQYSVYRYYGPAVSRLVAQGRTLEDAFYEARGLPSPIRPVMGAVETAYALADPQWASLHRLSDPTRTTV